MFIPDDFVRFDDEDRFLETLFFFEGDGDPSVNDFSLVLEPEQIENEVYYNRYMINSTAK